MGLFMFLTVLMILHYQNSKYTEVQGFPIGFLSDIKNGTVVLPTRKTHSEVTDHWISGGSYYGESSLGEDDRQMYDIKGAGKVTDSIRNEGQSIVYTAKDVISEVIGNRKHMKDNVQNTNSRPSVKNIPSQGISDIYGPLDDLYPDVPNVVIIPTRTTSPRTRFLAT